jgi:PAS domain S-box-containing protein
MSDANAPNPDGVPAADAAETARWFFQNSRDLFCVSDMSGRILEVNRAWTDLTGWTAEDLIGSEPMALCHPEDAETWRETARQLRRTGEAVTVGRLRTREGRWLWFEGRSWLSDRGQLVAIMRDITGERARDEELAAARHNQSMLSEAAGIGTWSFDPRENRIQWSDDILRLYGWPADQMDTPDRFFERLESSEVKAVEQAFRTGVETGAGASIEHRMLTADGRWLAVRSTFRTERRGRLFALRGISQNVTELVTVRDAALQGQARVRRLVEEASTNTHRLRLALGAAEAGAFEINHEARTFWASEQFTRLVGQTLTFEQAAAQVWHNSHPDDRDLVLDTRRRWSAGDHSAVLEFRILHPVEGPRWVRVFYALDPESRRGVGLVMDVDSRKRQELALMEAERAAQEAGEAKGRFLANMSHELRTPMNGVLGVLHLLDAEPLSQGGRQLLTEALACGRMLTALLDDVVDFSRIEAGRLDLSSDPVRIQDIAEGVVRLLEPQARAKGVALSLTIDSALGWAMTDPVRLRQALFNLVGNAVKFTLKGEVAVRVARQPDGALTFEVEDSGIGIPLEAQAGLFQRFSQADASTTRRFGGSGLGLAITARLADMMGGGVTFISRPGQGSTFRLSVAAPETPEPVLEPVLDAPLLEGLRILVVEDNPTNRMIARKLLESMGAQVSTATDGQCGVEAAALGAFDLILMDIQMPGMDGLEATRRIRAMAGPAARTPIIALTANAMSHQHAAYRAAGMDGVVSKPISPPTLLGEIVRLSEAPSGSVATEVA